MILTSKIKINDKTNEIMEQKFFKGKQEIDKNEYLKSLGDNLENAESYVLDDNNNSEYYDDPDYATKQDSDNDEPSDEELDQEYVNDLVLDVKETKTIEEAMAILTEALDDAYSQGSADVFMQLAMQYNQIADDIKLKKINNK